MQGRPRRLPALRTGTRTLSWGWHACLLLSERDSALLGSLVAALLAEQNTAQPDDELLRFGSRGRRLLESR